MRSTPPQLRPRKRLPSVSEQQRRFDRTNAIAAAVILANPEKHSRFQVDWTSRYTARRTAGDENTGSSEGVR